MGRSTYPFSDSARSARETFCGLPPSSRASCAADTKRNRAAQKARALLCWDVFKLANSALSRSNRQSRDRPTRLKLWIVISAMSFFLEVGHRCGEFTNGVAKAGISAPDVLAQFTQGDAVDA